MSVTKVFFKIGLGHQVTMPILTAMYFLQETRYVVHENCIKNMTWTRRGYLNRGFDVFLQETPNHGPDLIATPFRQLRKEI